MKSKSARKPPKISPSEACDRAISRMLPDATESERGYIIYRALQDTGGASKLMCPQFTTCPTCGYLRLEKNPGTIQVWATEKAKRFVKKLDQGASK